MRVTPQSFDKMAEKAEEKKRGKARKAGTGTWTDDETITLLDIFGAENHTTLNFFRFSKSPVLLIIAGSMEPGSKIEKKQRVNSLVPVPMGS